MFEVYFHNIMSYEYPFTEKNCPELTKKNFLVVFTRTLDSERSRWDRYVQPPNFLPHAEQKVKTT